VVGKIMLRLLILLTLPQLALAFSWQDLWVNKNQQGSHLLAESKNAQAAAVFKDRNWKGVAYYRDKQYESSYAEFKQDDSANGLYNQGNALANMQKYKEAIDAYSKAIEQKKDFPDAVYNKELIEKLLKQQQDKSDKNEQQQNQSDKNKQDQSEQSKSDQAKQDNQSSDKQQQSDKDQSQSGQNKQDQQNKSEQNQQNQNQQNQGQNADKNQPQNNLQQQNDSKAQQNGQNDKQQQDNNGNPIEANQQSNEQAQDKTANSSNYNDQEQKYQDPEVKAALSKIPDDPGGLLRNKFSRDYQQQKQDGDSE
jgi:Ca-activated chloride channel family protein